MSNAMNRNLSEPQVRAALERARVERAEALWALFAGLAGLPRRVAGALTLQRKHAADYRAAPCA